MVPSLPLSTVVAQLRSLTGTAGFLLVKQNPHGGANLYSLGPAYNASLGYRTGGHESIEAGPLPSALSLSFLVGRVQPDLEGGPLHRLFDHIV